MAAITYGDVSWTRMSNAVERVRRRLLRAASALEEAKVPYAGAGGNAVAGWVSRVDEAAVRNTQDVDIVLRRENLRAARKTLERAGFVYRHAAGVDMFLDGQAAKARDAVYVVSVPAPDVAESEKTGDFRLLSLDALDNPEG